MFKSISSIYMYTINDYLYYLQDSQYWRGVVFDTSTKEMETPWPKTWNRNI